MHDDIEQGFIAVEASVLLSAVVIVAFAIALAVFLALASGA